jgi:type I restriction enzyme S subunit
MGNLARGRIKLDKQEFIVPQEQPAERDRLFEDDVLFNTRNTLDLVGKVAIWRNELPTAYFNSNLMRMKFEKSRVSSYKFINAILNTPQSLISLRGVAIGTTSVAAIYSRDLVKVRIPLPTKAEQEAIAEALSDADALIESLEQLIAKKRQIKQGAMQELLSPKKGWTPRQLGDLLTFKNGLNKGKEFFGYGEPIVNYMDVFTSPVLAPERIQGRVSLSTQERANFDVRNGDVFFTRTSETPEEVGMAAVMIGDPKETVFSGFVLRARPRNADLNSLYLAYALRSTVVRDQIVSKASYTTRALTNGRILSEVDFAVPSLSEQAAIATILSDMDAEIAALEAKLAKARQVKQGMMQELLTGRIRLV